MSLASFCALVLALFFFSFISVALAGVNTEAKEVASVQNERGRNIEYQTEKPETRISSFEFPSPSCLSDNKIRLRVQSRTQAQTWIQEWRTRSRAKFEIILNWERRIGVTTRNLSAKRVLHQVHRIRLPDFALIHAAEMNMNGGRFGIGAVLEFNEERLTALKGGDRNVSVSRKMWRW